jgi:predicted nucleic acid-binding Zn ribbon protein
MSLGDILLESIRSNTRESSMLRRAYILGLWEEVVGKSVAARTQQVFLRDKQLFVEFSSSAARSEALMRRDEIVAGINEQAQAHIVSELILR